MQLFLNKKRLGYSMQIDNKLKWNTFDTDPMWKCRLAGMRGMLYENKTILSPFTIPH